MPMTSHMDILPITEHEPYKLGFVYIFMTQFEGIYKCGFTESSLSSRATDHRHKMGLVNLESVVMTVDSRLQEESLLREAWKFSDSIKTLLARKSFNSSEMFYLEPSSLALLKMHLHSDIGRRPFFGASGISKARSRAIRQSMAFNESISPSNCDAASLKIKCSQLDKALRKTMKMVEHE